ncbi:hypothetical protein HOY80DRAFT_285162 [Tuber brumale]|nr:hypothetical protein HOY80DRAFT_285162 [Tuber brumale]
MIPRQPALLYTMLIWAAASVAVPLDSGLDLEGMSNKLRSGSIAIANPYHPSDMRRERIVKQNGVIVYLESEPGPDPDPENPDEALDDEPIPAEKPRRRPKKPKGMAKLAKNRETGSLLGPTC